MIDIIIIEPEHPGNVGAICRAMANFGFYRLIVVNPKCDMNDTAIPRRAKHSYDKVKIVIKKTIPKYALCIATTAKINSDYNVHRMPLRPKEIAKKIQDLIANKPKASIGIMFGRESIGLTNREIENADLLMTIDADSEYPTLNLSHAVAIILYELHQYSTKKKAMNRIEMIHDVDKKQLNKMIDSVIKKYDNRGPHKTKIVQKIWHSVFAKAFLTRREAFGMMGLLQKLSLGIARKKEKVKREF